MNNLLSQVEQAALRLSPLDRARLASVLLRSLDSEVDADPECLEENWMREILLRSDALHCGEIAPIDGDIVIRELRNLIRTHQY